MAKVSFSSQEWCGHVWHQIAPRGGKLSGIFHSYFDGEADGSDDLAFPKDGVFEDALPILLRGWNGVYLKPGETRTVPFLPSLLWVRLHHRSLAWTTAAYRARPRSDSPGFGARGPLRRDGVHGRRPRMGGRSASSSKQRRPIGSSARPAPTGKS